MVHLGIGQRRRRLVERQDAALERERARHLHELPVGRGQRAGEVVRRDGDVKPLDQRPGPVAHRPLAQEPAASQLAPGEDVGGHAQVRKREHLLVHDADAVRQRVARPRERDRPAVEAQLAAVGAEGAREDLQQRRLAGAVLADERVRLARRNVEADAAERAHGAERLADVAEGDRGGAHAFGLVTSGLSEATEVAEEQRRNGVNGDETEIQEFLKSPCVPVTSVPPL